MKISWDKLQELTGDSNETVRELAKLLQFYYPKAAYRAWVSMHQRCSNPSHSRYRDYGGRGISVCSRWSGAQGLQNFIEDMGVRPLNQSLDRIDFNGNYEPSNCRWATYSEQTKNTRTYVPAIPKKRDPKYGTRISNPMYRVWGSKYQSLCPEWKGRGGFDKFYSVVGDRPKGKELHRKLLSLPFGPENYQWITKEEATEMYKTYKKSLEPIYTWKGSY